MSHELRTPLNVIMGYTEMLADGVVRTDEPAFEDTLGRIRTQSVELLEPGERDARHGPARGGPREPHARRGRVEPLFGELARELDPLAPPTVQCAGRTTSTASRS